MTLGLKSGVARIKRISSRRWEGRVPPVGGPASMLGVMTDVSDGRPFNMVRATVFG